MRTLPDNDTWECYLVSLHLLYRTHNQVQWGGTHRFNDTADVESKHRISLKSHGNKIRVRTDTQTEKDLLRCVQEEIVFETLDELLMETAEDPGVTIAEEIKEYQKNDVAKERNHTVTTLTARLHNDKYVAQDQHGLLVHEEVLLSWGELLRMFGHCFPSFANDRVQAETKWGVYQHALHESGDGVSRYHYWGTDTRYPVIQRGGTRRRRDMVRVRGVDGQHLAQIVCFVKATQPTLDTPPSVGVLVRWLTPHEEAIMYHDEPTCPGPLRHTHNLWSWHRTDVRRTDISGYHYGRLPETQKKWLIDCRESLMFASYDVVEFHSLGKYANVARDFDRANAFLESASWA